LGKPPELVTLARVPKTDDKIEPLNFERAEFEGGSATATAADPETSPSAAEPVRPQVCGPCQAPLPGVYFQANGSAVCADCYRGLQQAVERGSSGAFGRALVFGTGGAIAGAALYYLVAAITGWEVGIVAIAVGILVGKGIRRGAGLHRHWVYPALGIALSYAAIVSTYVPDVLQAWRLQELEELALPQGPGLDVPLTFGRVLAAFLVASIVPGLALAKLEVMGPIILGIGLWEGWRYSKAPQIAFSGPHGERTDEPGVLVAPAS
jgi:hypothetical protein